MFGGVYFSCKDGRMAILPKWIKTSFMRLYDVELWIKYRIQPSYMHHMVFTKLRPGWHDVDIVMEAAMVALLRRYVEFEEGGADKLRKWSDELIRHVNDDAHAFERDALKRQANNQYSILEVYQWFTVDKPKLRKQIKDLHPQKPMSKDTYDQIAKLENEIDTKTTEMLIRLVELRQTLWT